MSSEGYISCASCHIEGGSDGRVWDFTQRSEGLRNTTELRGRSGMGHGRVHWSGNFDEIQDFENDIRNFFSGTGFMSDDDFAATEDPLGVTTKAGLSDDLDDLAAYVTSLDNTHLPRSPYREDDGSLSADAEFGRQVYSAMNCALCHGGEELTDSNLDLLHALGTLRTTSGERLGRFSLLDSFKTWRKGNTEMFAAELDQLHRAVASFKEQGIYTYFGHLFWDTHVSALNDEDLPGLKKGEKATAALFFNKPLQEKYLAFVADLMTPVNPYTGLSLAEDPAVAILEVQNESNTLFWTLNRKQLPAHTVGLIEKGFGAFAADKYGSVEEAIAYWGDRREGDDPQSGKAGMMDAWFLTSAAPENTLKRAADQIEFLTQAQYRFYSGMKAAFHSMGIRKMIAASNWKTADPSNLGPLEHYSYTAVDMVNKNEYFSPKSIRNPRFYQVEPGDEFVPLSAIRTPEAAGALMAAKPAGIPYMVTESNWDEPNLYRAEWPFLVATYGAAAGIDGWNFFAYDAPMWYTGGNTWAVNSPEVLGQFPAYALMFRRGDVAEGPAAVIEHVPLEHLYQRKSIALPEIQYKDEVWKRQLGGDPKVNFKSQLDPKVFFTGPVELYLDAEEYELQTADLDRLIDEEKGVIYNTNEQLEWHYKQGYVKVDTPRSQAVAGFMAETGPVRLSDALIDMKNNYGTLAVVSLDSEPLAQSESILIQAGTRDKAYGFQLEELGEGSLRVESMGSHPLNVKKVRATVALRDKAGFRVTALDELGYPTDIPVQSKIAGNALVITFPEDALYIHVSR